MRKLLKIFAGIIGILVLSFVIYFLYLVWPSFFPKYEVGTCVIDTKINRIHKITGFDDVLKGSGVATQLVTTGAQSSIFVNDDAIKPVDCPK